MNKIIVILGPTASGKSDLAVRLAQAIGGEIISADSRQVYTGLNIGTGKITLREMKGVPHHLLDVVSPKKIFNAGDFKKLGEEAIEKIIARGRVPIIVGGTGFYIQALADGIVMPQVVPNAKLRKKLSSMSLEKLFITLKKMDPARARAIDAKNQIRLIRAIEIATVLGKVPKLTQQKKYDAVYIGIKIPEEVLIRRIENRLQQRLKQGMIGEVKNLHAKGLSWARMDALGLEYRYISRYLRGEFSKKELTEILSKEIRHYAKRQMTWFKRDKRIIWYAPTETKKILSDLKKVIF